MQSEYWNEVAGPKWAASQVQMDESLAPYAEALHVDATLEEGSTLIDVGCGCGATTLMAGESSPGADILGLDVSQPMLDVARTRAAAQGLGHLRFALDDAASHPVARASVDRVISRFGVMFFADPGAAFKHMRRWLKPEGYMALVVWATRAENPWMTESLAVLQRHIELPTPDPDAPGPFALGAEERRREVFAQAGLRVVGQQAIEQPFFVRGDLPELVRFLGERGPVAAALAGAEAATRQAALDDLAAYIEPQIKDGGIRNAAKAYRLVLTPA